MYHHLIEQLRRNNNIATIMIYQQNETKNMIQTNFCWIYINHLFDRIQYYNPL